MVHVKLTNVLLFLLIASLWFLAYTFIQLDIDMRNHQIKQEIKALKQELTKKETNKQNDFQPPELEDNPAILYNSDYVKPQKVTIPGMPHGNH